MSWRRPRVRAAADALARFESAPILRRSLGSPALFGIVQGFTAASIYFGLGMVVDSARGWTWLVLLAAAAFFLLLVLSYVEGASLHQERGGATVIARFGFNELWSFAAGWAILLDYLILLAITAFVVADYMAVLWAPLGSGAPAVAISCVIIAWVARTNVRGITPRRFERAAVVVVADLAVQLLVVVLGFILLLSSDVLTEPASFGGNRSAGDLLFAFTLAIIAFAGIDASSGLAGEVAVSRRGLRRLISARLIATTVPYVGIGLVAVSALPVGDGPRGQNEQLIDAPMLDVVAAFEQDWLSEPLRYLVALSAVAVLTIACNAAMLGLSRLGYSLALNRQIPSAIGRLHPRHSTPVFIIVAGAMLAVALVVPRDLEFLAGIYAFGATFAFTIVHLAICSLRYREPDRDRPYTMPFNVRIGKGRLPLPAALGALVSGGAFIAVLILHSGARFVGLAWMMTGITLYVAYRRSNDKPVFKRVTIPERALTRTEKSTAEYGSILVPVLGTPLDDDIMQTAGRLSSEDDADGEGGTVIEALWVFEVPMALPVDARIAESELKRARAALARAKAVGEEYDGVEVATATVRARRTGEAIVHEARRRGVEAIVLAAEEPTRIKGGALLGGRGDASQRDTFVGETTRYVVNKAPCRVILTAPPVREPPPGAPAGAPDEIVGDLTLPAAEEGASPAASR